MATFAQDGTNDILLTNGQMSLLTAADEFAQVLRTRLQFFEGEWFLDTRLGVPYFQYILVKNPDLRIIERIFRAVIFSIPNAAQVLRLELTNNPDRTLSVNIRVQMNSGAIVSGGTGAPFIVEVR